MVWRQARRHDTSALSVTLRREARQTLAQSLPSPHEEPLAKEIAQSPTLHQPSQAFAQPQALAQPKQAFVQSQTLARSVTPSRGVTLNKSFEDKKEQKGQVPCEGDAET